MTVQKTVWSGYRLDAIIHSEYAGARSSFAWVKLACWLKTACNGTKPLGTFPVQPAPSREPCWSDSDFATGSYREVVSGESDTAHETAFIRTTPITVAEVKYRNDRKRLASAPYTLQEIDLQTYRSRCKPEDNPQQQLHHVRPHFRSLVNSLQRVATPQVRRGDEEARTQSWRLEKI